MGNSLFSCGIKRSKTGKRQLPVDRIEEMLSLHETFLEERLDPDFGLLDKLLANEGLIRSEIDVIKAKETLEKRNSELLQIIAAKKFYSNFIDALRETRQTHLVNYLKGNGEHRSEYEFDWPLTRREVKILDTNQSSLVELINPSELVAHLFASGVLNVRQRDAINSEQVDYKKNGLLLEILIRKSLKDFFKVVEWLKTTKQNHVADILINGGTVVPVHANIEDPTARSDQTEAELVTAITNLLGNKSLPECNRILEMVPLRLIGIRIGQSVVLYFYCETSIEHVQLYRMLNDGELQKCLENLFNAVLSYKRNTQRSTINVHGLRFEGYLFSDDRRILDERRPPEIGQPFIDGTCSELNSLPFELIDMILEKVCLHELLFAKNMKDNEIAQAIMLVNFCWFQRIRKSNLKATIMQNLKQFYQRSSRKMTLIRNNMNYFIEQLQVKGLPNALHSAGCLTDVERRLANGRKGSRYQSIELLEALKRNSTTQYLEFADCLRKSNQRILPRILEFGGVAVNLKFKSRSFTNSVSMEQSMAQKLNDLHNKKIPWNTETQTQQNRLKAMDLEILNFYYNNGIGMWLHCKSQDALQRLEALTPTSGTLDTLSRVIAIFTGLKVDLAHSVFCIDDCIKKDIAWFSTVARPCADIVIRPTGNFIVGMAKLNGMIYFLSREEKLGPGFLEVYSNKAPYPRITEINIDFVKIPRGIVESKTDNCLYIYDFGNRFIWKLDARYSNRLLLRDLNRQYRLSMCSDGGLIVTRSQGFEIFDTEANMKRKISLPIEIFGHLRNAVETSTGNFIVSHLKTKIWAVSEVTPESVIVRRFLHNIDSPSDYYPNLCLDADDRVIAAVSCDNRIVILVDHDLIFVQVLLENHTIDNKHTYNVPLAIYFDKQERQLIVEHLYGRAVRFYKLNSFK